MYGHPHKETITRLKDAEVKIWSTKESGALKLRMNNDKIWLEEYMEKE